MTLLLLFAGRGTAGPVVIPFNLVSEFVGTFDSADTGLTFDAEIFYGSFDVADWQ